MFITKARHEMEMAQLRDLVRERTDQRDGCKLAAAENARMVERLSAEIATLRPLAEKHLRALANLKQNKGRGK